MTQWWGVIRLGRGIRDVEASSQTDIPSQSMISFLGYSHRSFLIGWAFCDSHATTRLDREEKLKNIPAKHAGYKQSDCFSKKKRKDSGRAENAEPRSIKIAFNQFATGGPAAVIHKYERSV